MRLNAVRAPMNGMGANTSKSDLDQAYRDLVARFLLGVMQRHDLTKTQLAEKLGIDRTVAGRYLSGKVRAPLQRLGYLQRTVKEYVPHDIVEAFYTSQAPAETLTKKAG